MEIREVREGDVLVLAPEGNISGTEETAAIETKFATALKGGTRFIVFDCSGLEQVPSPAIRVLLMTSRKLNGMSGRLVLCGMSAKAQKAFSISGLDKDFVVVATRDEALHRVLEPVPASPPRAPRASPPGPPAKAERPAAPVPAPPASVPAPAPPVLAQVPAAVPDRPDPREALATVILETLRVNVPRREPASRTARSDLAALANGVLTALRVGRE
jgi:anti-anti-sigma factor